MLAGTIVNSDAFVISAGIAYASGSPVDRCGGAG